MSKQQIKLLNSVTDIYKGKSRPVKEDVGFIVHDFNEVTLQYPYTSGVYRTNYYSFLFIKDGSGSYTLDDATFHFSANCFYFSNPGHIKSHYFEQLREAYRIAVTEEFIVKYIHPDIFNEFPFLIAETSVPQALDADDVAVFENIFKQIQREFNSSAPSSYRITGKYFAILLYKIKDKFWANYLPLEEGDRSSQIVRNFKKNMELHFSAISKGAVERIFTVADFAELQNLNANYFNQVIKSKTGRTVTEWLNNKMLVAAQGLLLHSPRSIKEIAFLLGFSDGAHFSKFFKKHTLSSPLQYRKAR
ncbi:helix-turn-helix domain-containing protein [Niabella insulamsoli]|uniref:helix-turn-helix domain-containing protein n=1 Tax=Niabella insulamsoli TaxID=3144874 RepID=UPI0031FE18F0